MDQGEPTTIPMSQIINGRSPIYTDTKAESTTKKEVWAWWLYMVAIEPISVAVLQLFTPLLLEALPALVGHIAGSSHLPCTGAEGERCILFEIGGFRITGTTFSYAIITLSVALQALFFICFGALADYGSNRRRFLTVSTALGTTFCLLTLLVRGSLSALIAGSLHILITIAFGASLMLYNSYLPLLAENHPDTISFRSEDPIEMARRREVVANDLSTKSFMLGYGSAVFVLIICAAYLMLIDASFAALRYLVSFCGLIWGLGSVYSLVTLKTRAGKELPANVSVWTFSAKKTLNTVLKCNQLSNAFRYLIAYFLFADGCNTIGQVAVIFARNVLNMPYENLIICTIIAPFCGVAGNFFFYFIQKRLKISSKTMLIWILIDFVLMTLYGGIGIFTDKIGLHHIWEMYMMAAFYGFHIGAMHSFSRVIFAEVVPLGEESEFFSLYAITDKGSSCLGPAIQALVTQYLSNQRYGLIFLGAMIIASFPILIWGFDPIKGKKEAKEFLASTTATATATSTDSQITGK